MKTKLSASLNTTLSGVGMLSASHLTDMGCSTSGCNISSEPFNKIFTTNNTNIWTTTYNGYQPSYMSSSGSLVLAYVHNLYSIRPIITVSKTIITNV